MDTESEADTASPAQLLTTEQVTETRSILSLTQGASSRRSVEWSQFLFVLEVEVNASDNADADRFRRSPEPLVGSASVRGPYNVVQTEKCVCDRRAIIVRLSVKACLLRQMFHRMIVPYTRGLVQSVLSFYYGEAERSVWGFSLPFELGTSISFLVWRNCLTSSLFKWQVSDAIHVVGDGSKNGDGGRFGKSNDYYSGISILKLEGVSQMWKSKMIHDHWGKFKLRCQRHTFKFMNC